MIVVSDLVVEVGDSFLDLAVSLALLRSALFTLAMSIAEELTDAILQALPRQLVLIATYGRLATALASGALLGRRSHGSQATP